MDDQRVALLQDQYLEAMDRVVRDRARLRRPPVLLLSSGFDSFLLAALLSRHVPPGGIRTVTIGTDSSAEIEGAAAIAEHFATDHFVRRVSVEEIASRLEIVRGMRYRSLSRLMSHVSFHLALESAGIAGADVYSGHGADNLYGDNPKLYRDAEALAAREGVEVDAVRTRIKTDHYFARNPGGHIRMIARAFHAEAVQPYLDPSVHFLARASHAITSVPNKGFAKAAFRRRFGHSEIADRPRLSLQDGSGLLRDLKKRLKADYRDAGFGRSVREIVAGITAEREPTGDPMQGPLRA